MNVAETNTGVEEHPPTTIVGIEPPATTALDTPDDALVSPSPKPQFIQITAEEYANNMRAIKDGQIAKKVKEMGIDYTNRRNTLIIRKATKLHPDLVSDEEVVAYYDLYKMRAVVLGCGKKVQISEGEIEAYLDLWTGANTPSLEAVENYIAKNSI